MPKKLNTSDEGHVLTENILSDLEKCISSVYVEAAKELQKTVDNYFAQFEKRDEEMKELIGTVQNGKEWTEKDYQQWRLAQIGRGERYEALRDKVSERYTKANETSIAYVNDSTPGIYSLNRNYTEYAIEQVAGDVGFTLWDEQTVKRLIAEQPDLMPYYPKEKAVKRGIDIAYGKSQITKSVTSSILQGKSIKGISDDLQNRIQDMNRTSAIRAARTAVTGAQNAGRMDGYKAAQNMGINLKREWLATLDGRTRHEHTMLDGQKAEIDKPFKVGGEEIMYPGDPAASPHLVYNCRCTLVAVLDDVDTSDFKNKSKDIETGERVLISNMSFSEWKKLKQKDTQRPIFTPASSIEEAQKYAEKFVESYKSKYTGKIDYKGIDLSFANEMNRAMTEVLYNYEVKYKIRNLVPFNRREKRFKDTTAEAAYQWITSDLYFNKDYLKNKKSMEKHIQEYRDLLKTVMPNIDIAIEESEKKTGFGASMQLRYAKALKNTGRTNVNEPGAYGSMVHELGHYLDDQIFGKARKESGFDMESSFEMYSGNISAYATSNTKEYVAESFAAYWNGETSILDPELVKVFERCKKK